MGVRDAIGHPIFRFSIGSYWFNNNNKKKGLELVDLLAHRLGLSNIGLDPAMLVFYKCHSFLL